MTMSIRNYRKERSRQNVSGWIFLEQALSGANRDMNAKGTVFKYGDNVDTDVIIPARYLNTSDPAELAVHCMEDIDADFMKRVKKGDIIVAEKNFGCGSSREHAPIAIKAAGVSCVIAETFARIFYRNDAADPCGLDGDGGVLSG